jgi:hypothetical protein
MSEQQNIFSKIRQLNDLALELQVPIDFDIECGSGPLGRSYKLLESHKDKTTLRRYIGRTIMHASIHLDGMLIALRAVDTARRLETAERRKQFKADVVTDGTPAEEATISPPIY